MLWVLVYFLYKFWLKLEKFDLEKIKTTYILEHGEFWNTESFVESCMERFSNYNSCTVFHQPNTADETEKPSEMSQLLLIIH